MRTRFTYLRAYVTGRRDATGRAVGSTAVSWIEDNHSVRWRILARDVPDRAVGGLLPRRVGRMAAAVAALLTVVPPACARSDEDRIRGQLDEVAQIVSVEDRETPLIRQARASRLVTYLTADADVDVGAPFSPVAGRDAVARVAAAVRVPAGGMSVEFRDVRMTVDDPTRRALASATAVVTAGADVGGELLQARELEMVFSEIDGQWLIAQVRLVGIR